MGCVIVHTPPHLKDPKDKVSLLHCLRDAAISVGVVHSQGEDELKSPPHSEQDVQQGNGQ